MEYNTSTVSSGINDSTKAAATPTPTWVIVFDNVQLSGAIIGFLANVATTVTLSVNGDDFSPIIRMLFKYQSFLDCLCCLQASLLFTLTPMWTTGNKAFDIFICQAWHSQYFYWLNVTLSVHNLVVLALERYLCVCHTLKYKLLTAKHFRLIILGVIILGIFYLTPGLFQTRFRDGRCYSELLWDTPGIAGLFYIYGISSFFYAYAIPTAFLLVLYGLVINSFRVRAKANLGASGTSSVIDKATSELTKTAIIVTVIFIISIGFDLWYYLLANVGLVVYVFNSPIQKVAVFFSVMNSAINPFIYASFMPLYRKSVKDTFFKSCSKK